MKRYQTLAIIVLITEAISMLFIRSGSQMLVYFFADHFPNKVSTIFMITAVLNLIIWLPAAIWVYTDAKEKPLIPLVWALMVLILGFKGVIFYLAFLLLFYLMDKSKIAEHI